MAILVQKLWGEKKLSKSVFGYFKTKKKFKKKVPMAIKLEGGGGKVLMAWTLVEELFFAASLRKCKFLLRKKKYVECSEISVRVSVKTPPPRRVAQQVKKIIFLRLSYSQNGLNLSKREKNKKKLVWLLIMQKWQFII